MEEYELFTGKILSNKTFEFNYFNRNSFRENLIKHGVQKIFYDNGNLCALTIVSNGNMNGIIYHYNEKGWLNVVKKSSSSIRGYGPKIYFKYDQCSR
jgi:antitoxin component YwqK of YwqJK toxin-antitoxin module